ncbi:MAG: hypothetical protein Q8N60_03630 [Candidatus Diapherotrites archaeon]|nr:hypothetical protein [Candidatus Diapherotrites archaeon]
MPAGTTTAVIKNSGASKAGFGAGFAESRAAEIKNIESGGRLVLNKTGN